MRWLYFFLLAILISCTSVVTTPDELARCGDAPSHGVATASATNAPMLLNLLDPQAAQIVDVRVIAPKVWRTAYQGKLYGWEASFMMNAKNAFGAYTGFKKYLMLITPEGRFYCREADAWHQ